MFDFLGIGGWELLLIIIIGLIVVGPNKIPEIARKAGKVMAGIKKTTSELMSEVTREVEAEKKATSAPTSSSLLNTINNSINLADNPVERKAQDDSMK
jgi:Tat protein translocase TatB subunit